MHPQIKDELPFWEQQFFHNVVIPTDLYLPLSDVSAYKLYPQHNWVYNKLELCKTQKIQAYPHGIPILHFPVFSKPIYNLYGLSIGAKILYDFNEEIAGSYQPGHFWMPLLKGTQYTFDCVVIRGSIVQTIPMRTVKDRYGCFISFEHVRVDYRFIQKWVLAHLPDFTGILNIETIDDIILECHLRCSLQFADLYGPSFIENLVHFYRTHIWHMCQVPKTRYSYVYRVYKPGIYSINEQHVQQARKLVSSIQITYYAGIPIEQQFNDMVSYRLAIINGCDYESVLAALAILQEGTVWEASRASS